MVFEIPHIPLGDGVEALVEWIEQNLGFLLDLFTAIMNILISGIRDILFLFPPVIFILIVAAIAYFVGRRDTKLAIGVAVALVLLERMRLWTQSMQTLSLVLAAALVALVIAIPIGIITAKNETLLYIIRPVLDFMQTMPSFVYLIPAVIFFGLGNVPGLVATIVFAMPPPIRLTILGIQHVPKELKEVGDAFGSTPMQKLMKIEIPSAMPSIMAGVNQCIMLSLSMVVIAAMIGAPGLGYQVLAAIQRIDIGSGFEAGLGIVIIAIILDRLTQSLTPKR
ncbi:binding-protein-dependent transport systems inner membrane component [Methanosalsum zhilinae DSM 4017]|uniref:Binding-protein-dependent transport systems inner membrane component n=1 Tax=Methanosalsum zhilinae (strain DSM 4017 / NBRC 107636 / OCM 62 / WeN5) TaxID=679901 RepID=F7XQ84_METZD|nr:proline/glycine betaine ABC transporter permease [Methanosalsum zhilinae]AEH61546.1 binding-protein-dependent transport systems inner membrane component [Methanosalsum zhilinae DSM 4017]